MSSYGDEVTIRVSQILYFERSGKVIYEEPMIFKRLFKEGQSLVLKSQPYEVESVSVMDGFQNVCIRPCELCEHCGGIKGKRQPPEECSCPT